MEQEHQITANALKLPARKITRHELAAHYGLSLRTIDELTRNGLVPFFKIGKAIRYDLPEVEATLRERFHKAASTKTPPVCEC